MGPALSPQVPSPHSSQNNLPKFKSDLFNCPLLKPSIVDYIMVPQKTYPPWISECDLIWNKVLCIYNQGRILRRDHPGLEWALISISITIRDWDKKKKKEREDTEERDVNMGQRLELWSLWLRNAKSCQQAPESRRQSWSRFSLRDSRGTNPADTGFWIFSL